MIEVGFLFGGSFDCAQDDIKCKPLQLNILANKKGALNGAPLFFAKAKQLNVVFIALTV